MHEIFANFRVVQNCEIKYLLKFSLPIKGLENTSRTLGKCEIKMKQNFYIAKAQN